MVVKGMYTLLGSMADYLNDNLTDPLSSTRAGSYVFGPDMDINTQKYTPKVQVTDAFTDDPSDYSFGANPRRNKFNVVNIIYFAHKGAKYTESSVEYKDRRLVYLFLSKIQDMVGSAAGSFVGMHRPRFGTVDRIGYNPGQLSYMGILPVTFMYRE